jgi:hypothetical protein
MLPDVSTSSAASAGESAGHRTSARRPSALRVPATQCPSGDGATSSHTVPAGSAGAGTVGRADPASSLIAASRPPPPAGATSRAPRVPRRQPRPGIHRYRSLRMRQREVKSSCTIISVSPTQAQSAPPFTRCPAIGRNVAASSTRSSLAPLPSSRTYATRRPSGDARGTGSARSRLSSVCAAGAGAPGSGAGSVPRGHSAASVRPGATRDT